LFASFFQIFNLKTFSFVENRSGRNRLSGWGGMNPAAPRLPGTLQAKAKPERCRADNGQHLREEEANSCRPDKNP